MQQTFITLICVLARVILAFQIPSTVLNFLLSSGSCLAISAESKIGCRYIHCPWHFIHSSITSLAVFSCEYQVMISYSKGFLKALNWID